MSAISTICFDLDGTLVDSSIGIHNTFTRTFDTLGVPSPDAKTIRGFMGPPLETSFSSCLPEELVPEAIKLYRTFYKERGIFEAKLFPQIEYLLQQLSQDYPLYITTTKTAPVAKEMTHHFGIDHFFDGIYGSSPETPHKSDVIRQVLNKYHIPTYETVIIGDTKYDMIGAQETGIKKLAVTWGFGEQADLLNYHPDWIAHTANDILGYFQKN